MTTPAPTGWAHAAQWAPGAVLSLDPLARPAYGHVLIVTGPARPNRARARATYPARAAQHRAARLRARHARRTERSTP